MGVLLLIDLVKLKCLYFSHRTDILLHYRDFYCDDLAFTIYVFLFLFLCGKYDYLPNILLFDGYERGSLSQNSETINHLEYQTKQQQNKSEKEKWRKDEITRDDIAWMWIRRQWLSVCCVQRNSIPTITFTEVWE